MLVALVLQFRQGQLRAIWRVVSSLALLLRQCCPLLLQLLQLLLLRQSVLGALLLLHPLAAQQELLLSPRRPLCLSLPSAKASGPALSARSSMWLPLRAVAHARLHGLLTPLLHLRLPPALPLLLRVLPRHPSLRLAAQAWQLLVASLLLSVQRRQPLPALQLARQQQGEPLPRPAQPLLQLPLAVPRLGRALQRLHLGQGASLELHQARRAHQLASALTSRRPHRLQALG